MWLENCTDEETITLMAIASLAASLPQNLAAYADALIEINRNYFKVSLLPKLPSHNPAGRSLMIPRKGK